MSFRNLYAVQTVQICLFEFELNGLFFVESE